MLKRTIVAAFISSKDEKVLFGKKNPQKGGVYLDKVHIPGGGVEDGESLKQALQREIQEETGIILEATAIPEPLTLETLYTTKQLPDGQQVPCEMEFYVFVIDLAADSTQISAVAGDDFSELLWIPKDKLKEYPHTPPTLSLLLRLGLLTPEQVLPQRPFRDADQVPTPYDGSPISWRVSAYALVVKGEELLIIKNRLEKLHDVIGGGIEFGEGVEDALHREAMEEGGARIKIGKLISTSFDWFYHRKGAFHQTMQLYYQAELTAELQQPTEADIEWVKFVPITEVKEKYPMPTAVEVAIEKLISEKATKGTE